ncbi:MAG: hypothetical protein R6W72_12195 [Desulfurivibrionaceae bacterium]
MKHSGKRLVVHLQFEFTPELCSPPRRAHCAVLGLYKKNIKNLNWYYQIKTMLSLNDKIRLFRLKRSIQKLRGEYEADIKKANKEGKDQNYIDDIIAEMFGMCRDDEFEIEKIITKDLKNKAQRYYIELPDRKDEKIWENNFGSYIFSEHGKAIISKQIKVHRREDYEFLIKILSVLIGLIGVLTGFYVLKN